MSGKISLRAVKQGTGWKQPAPKAPVRIPHSGGKITTNSDAALAKFLLRKQREGGGGGGRSGGSGLDSDQQQRLARLTQAKPKLAAVVSKVSWS